MKRVQIAGIRALTCTINALTAFLLRHQVAARHFWVFVFASATALAIWGVGLLIVRFFGVHA
ncbi:hypothetical protein NLM33_35785 [Bradyrhizobium sp. CCGUVB1N3]|uniref:hypothetical protein n=1 Tax=Bradyrhizobium sp. CCGUVB1N3 TaxID=2949629 RepID=UPI0020B336B7|nr:hypothetical protein [Bradyrhizobium sp. CCGUVB1N3]MCP3475637.1 hypothetical protein [Bradyrhizobium sp. CCGUVB1N3]